MTLQIRGTCSACFWPFMADQGSGQLAAGRCSGCWQILLRSAPEHGICPSCRKLVLTIDGSSCHADGTPLCVPAACTIPSHQAGEHTAACIPPADPRNPELRLLRAVFDLCSYCDDEHEHEHSGVHPAYDPEDYVPPAERWG